MILEVGFNEILEVLGELSRILEVLTGFSRILEVLAGFSSVLDVFVASYYDFGGLSRI